MRLVDAKTTLTLELDRHEHYRLAAALRDVCIFAEKESSDLWLKHNVKEGVEPFLYFLNLSIPSKATAGGWPDNPDKEESDRAS